MARALICHHTARVRYHVTSCGVVLSASDSMRMRLVPSQGGMIINTGLRHRRVSRHPHRVRTKSRGFSLQLSEGCECESVSHSVVAVVSVASRTVALYSVRAGCRHRIHNPVDDEEDKEY